MGGRVNLTAWQRTPPLLLGSFEGSRGGTPMPSSSLRSISSIGRWKNLRATRESHHVCKALDYPELRRLDALEEDMAYFYGRQWRSEVTMTPATEAYVRRIEEVAADSNLAYLLVAHQYTRYLGDLFGGQMMGAMATKSLGLDENKGVAFYNFPKIVDQKAFITMWYGRLNELELSDQEKKSVVDEANRVFALNTGLLEELEGNAVSSATSVWRMTSSIFVSSLKEANPAVRKFFQAVNRNPIVELLGGKMNGVISFLRRSNPVIRDL